MASRTFSGAVDTTWSNAGNWDTKPVDGDTATIPITKTCMFDENHSAYVTGIILVVTGTFTVKTTGGPYYFKAGGDITGTGSFLWGSALAPLPAAVITTIDFMAASRNFHMTGAAVVGLYPTHPANVLARLTVQAEVGATVLSVDTDVSADLWIADDWLRVNRVRKGDVDSELRQFASATSNTITLKTGLTAIKEIGSIVVLLKRNILVTGSTGYVFDGGTGWHIGAEIRGNANGVFFGSGHTISGTVSGNTYGVFSGSGHTISGTVSGNTYGVIYGSGHTISGTVSGNTSGVYYGSGHTISGTVSGNTSGVIYGGFTGYGMTFSGNTNDVVFSGINSGPLIRGRSFRHLGVANDTRAWSAGGSITHETSEKPTGKNFSHKFTNLDSGYWNTIEWEIPRTLGLTISFPCYGKNDIAGLTSEQRLHFQIIAPNLDPLVNSANTPLAEWITADSTAWQSSILSYSCIDDLPLVLRICCKRGSGNAYAYFDPIELAAISAGVTALLADVGDASASTLGSLYAILGNAVATLTSRIPAALDGTYMASQVKGQDNIDFGALQKASLNAATPASVQNIPATGSGFTALGDTRIANLDVAVSTISAATRDLAITDAVTAETFGGMIHALYCADLQKQTVTNSERKIFKLDDITTLRTQSLSDDSTTVTRGGG